MVVSGHAGSNSFPDHQSNEPEEDDWKKLVRVLKYLKDTVDIVLTLSTDNVSVVK